MQYTSAESFYIFTCCNLVSSNDQRKFYRMRVLYSSLRVFYLLADIRKKLELGTFIDESGIEGPIQLSVYLINL